MEAWRKVWRDGIAPGLSTAALAALRDGLRADDPNLIQGATMIPPPLMCVRDRPIEAGCVIVFGSWKAGEVRVVHEGEDHFAGCCFDADQRLDEPAGCRWLLNWFDDTPRDLMRAELLAEVELVLRSRVDAPAHTPQESAP